MSALAVFDSELVRRYDCSAPRYTSYPTAPWFERDFSETDCRTAAERSNRGRAPLSLYLHLP